MDKLSSIRTIWRQICTIVIIAMSTFMVGGAYAASAVTTSQPVQYFNSCPSNYYQIGENGSYLVYCAQKYFNVNVQGRVPGQNISPGLQFQMTGNTTTTFSVNDTQSIQFQIPYTSTQGQIVQTVVSCSTVAMSSGQKVQVTVTQNNDQYSVTTKPIGSYATNACNVSLTSSLPETVSADSIAPTLVFTADTPTSCSVNQTYSNGQCVCKTGYHADSDNNCIQTMTEKFTLNFNTGSSSEPLKVTTTQPPTGVTLQNNVASSKNITFSLQNTLELASTPLTQVTVTCGDGANQGASAVFNVLYSNNQFSLQTVSQSTPKSGACGVQLPATMPTVTGSDGNYTTTLNVNMVNAPTCNGMQVFDSSTNQCQTCPANNVSKNNQCVPCGSGQAAQSDGTCKSCPAGSSVQNGQCVNSQSFADTLVLNLDFSNASAASSSAAVSNFYFNIQGTSTYVTSPSVGSNYAATSFPFEIPLSLQKLTTLPNGTTELAKVSVSCGSASSTGMQLIINGYRAATNSQPMIVVKTVAGSGGSAGANTCAINGINASASSFNIPLNSSAASLNIPLSINYDLPTSNPTAPTSTMIPVTVKFYVNQNGWGNINTNFTSVSQSNNLRSVSKGNGVMYQSMSPQVWNWEYSYNPSSPQATITFNQSAYCQQGAEADGCWSAYGYELSINSVNPLNVTSNSFGVNSCKNGYQCDAYGGESGVTIVCQFGYQCPIPPVPSP